jgi:excisionase family DNA binding protein
MSSVRIARLIGTEERSAEPPGSLPAGQPTASQPPSQVGSDQDGGYLGLQSRRKAFNEESLHSVQSQDQARTGGLNGNGAAKRQSLPQVNTGCAAERQPAFEPVLDSQGAADLLRIHPKTLQRMARNGEIPAFRIGKLWGFRASALNRWLESKLGS